MKKISLLLALALSAGFSYAQSPVLKEVSAYTDKNYPALDKLYKQLHQNPELSLQEEKTAQVMASELKSLGFEVMEKMGAHGVVGVLKNGKGPTVLIRTDMDALPLEEKTGLPYASTARGVNAAGNEVNVMHACGHDIHMTVFTGTARALVHTKNQWKGTLVMVAQSAEENGFGADLMFKAGLYDKIPTPDYAIAMHDNASLPAGKIGYREGAFMASVDMMDITVFGQGGHGAAPHTTIDPVVLSSQMVLAFQTVVSRTINPIEPAVVTVGSIHGGTVHNIIPDEVKLQLTLRSYSDEVREQIISSIRRISKNLAESAGLPENKMPVISIRDPQTPATINDPALTNRLVSVLRKNFGEENLVEMPPNMVGEDFSRFGRQEKEVPICMFWLGAVDPAKVREAEQKGEALPSLHSPLFAPLPEPTIKTGVKAMSAAALELFGKSK
ncbi:amidohydrolase [Pontibacter diazotrophicus]|uniref:Amidohydrolase n=1 Tax=Pontibacter diazotrophicus TaxID=1400979 RepID=A0A3D8L6Z9_9BACT|nr:amidohydrolase [Pontibacter diazotrophicus]RDV13178.1 amidohydrolase [Pontibacter diazotrophicus]